jgi:hypothetical protein
MLAAFEPDNICAFPKLFYFDGMFAGIALHFAHQAAAQIGYGATECARFQSSYANT